MFDVPEQNHGLFPTLASPIPFYPVYSTTARSTGSTRSRIKKKKKIGRSLKAVLRLTAMKVGKGTRVYDATIQTTQ